MKTFIAIRHGKYGDYGKLTYDGRKETRELAKELPRPSIILTSPVERAYDTALVLAEEFGLMSNQIITVGELGSDTSNEVDIAQIWNRVQEEAQDFDTILVITHYATVGPLAEQFHETICSIN